MSAFRADAEVAILVHLGHVAGQQPVVLAQHPAGGLGVPPIPQHDLRTPHGQFADVTHGNRTPSGVQVHHHGLGGGQGDADASGFAHAVEGVGMGDRSGLGEAVTLHQTTPGQAFEGFLDFQGKR